MRVFLPNAPFHLANCVSLQSRRVGKISVAKSFGSAGRRFGCSDLRELLLKVQSRRELNELNHQTPKFMPLLKPDPTFYPSPRLAMQAPPEKHAFVAALNPPGSKLNDALLVVDVDPKSSTYGQRVGKVKMPKFGDELHHFGWNACSSALCPYSPHPHVERRYLVVPGIRSSRIHIIETKPDPRKPQIVKVIEPEEVFARSNYSRPHTIHCGPEAIYVSALGDPKGEGPGGIFMLDCETFDVLGQWEVERGDQFLHYDFWWHLGFDTLMSSEWGTPNMIENGVQPDLLLGGKYGHQMHVWDLRRRRHLQTLDLGSEQQMVLEMRPAHDPRKAYGFVGVVVSLNNLSASVWLWHRQSRGPSEEARSAARGRPANGGSESRRQANLFYQLALCRVGRTILPR